MLCVRRNAYMQEYLERILAILDERLMLYLSNEGTEMQHVATINAFANKFGTFTGAVLDKETRKVIRERFETMDEARNWAKQKAYEMFGVVNYAAMPRKGEYLANCWK